MQIHTLSQIATWPIGTPITATRGTITRVGKASEGRNSYGPWTFQPIEIQDGGTSMKVSLFSHDILAPGWVGVPVLLLTGSNKDGKAAGLAVQQDKRAEGNPAATLIELKGGLGAKVEAENEKAVHTQAPAAVPPPQGLPPPAPLAPPTPPRAAPVAAPPSHSPPVQQPPAAPPQPEKVHPHSIAKEFIGRNRTLLSIALVALRRTVEDYEARYMVPFPRELYSPSLGAIMYGASSKGIPDIVFPGCGIEHFDPAPPPEPKA
jgi:hypothetical protein